MRVLIELRHTHSRLHNTHEHTRTYSLTLTHALTSTHSQATQTAPPSPMLGEPFHLYAREALAQRTCEQTSHRENGLTHDCPLLLVSFLLLPSPPSSLSSHSLALPSSLSMVVQHKSVVTCTPTFPVALACPHLHPHSHPKLTLATILAADA